MGYKGDEIKDRRFTVIKKRYSQQTMNKIPKYYDLWYFSYIIENGYYLFGKKRMTNTEGLQPSVFLCDTDILLLYVHEDGSDQGQELLKNGVKIGIPWQKD